MKFFLRVIFFLFISTSLVAQDSSSRIESGIPKTTIFLPNDYGGEAQNFDFIQDDKGVLYIANTVGFLEFNGTSWRNFKPDNDGVPVSFLKDTKGRIFTGGTGFIGFLEKNNSGETYFVSLKDKLPNDFAIGIVWDIYSIDDRIYFRNDNNIIKYENSKIEVLIAPEPIQNLFTFNKTIYCNTGRGLYKLENKKFVFIASSEILAKFNVRNIFELNTKLIIVTLKNGLYILNDNIIKPLQCDISTFIKEKMLYTAGILDDQTVYFSTIRGGVLLTDKNLSPKFRISEKSGLSNNSAKKIKQDYQGNLWIGSDKGITKMNYPITTTFYHKNKSKIGTIEEITSHKKEIYLGASLGTFKLKTISKKDLLTDNYFAEFSHLPNDMVDNFANFSLKSKLLFSGLNGTQEYRNNKTSSFSPFSARKFYKSIHYKNIVFMGHAFGCEILILNEKDEIQKIENITNLPEIRGIAEDIDKNLWLTTVSDGVLKVVFKDSLGKPKLKKFGLKDGLPSLRDNLVYNINNNDVLFTTHKGLFKFDKNSQKFIPETRFGDKYAGGKDEFIYAFNFDKNENSWMHSFRKKVSIVAMKDSLGKYTLYEKPLKDIGQMQAYEILSEPEKKVVWYGGSDGLARFDYSKIRKEKIIDFNALITKVIGVNDSILIRGHQFNRNIKTMLKPNQRDFRFEVGATDYTNLEEIKYQYKLEGYDKNWSDWTKESFKIYTNLNYGEYTFKVKSKNYLDNISKTDKYSFLISPFWYQTTFFKILVLILVLTFLIYIINYFSKRKFVKKVHELELAQKFEKEKNEAIVKEKERGLKALIDAQESERSRIARELHDGVVQQIGSVILKSRNILAKMNLLQTKESQELLKSLENSNQDLRTISHQMMPRALKELGILSALNDLLENSLVYTNVAYSLEHFNIKERLPQKIEITIYRIVQELINNIIKHSKATEVSVQIFNANNTIILIVEDNGVGFAKGKSKKGIGLLNISSRLDMVNGDVNFEPSPKSGTLVTIKIPLE
ncbi:sensor histidine kinase [Polaribacter aquimarinus]|uniref:Histidine kinase domain-containing protein n=1 Tax=Polaribacter aquimarinus TaxID=2100726 RepID=A0A2U2J8K2_9FLAO|nr:ATP-binding protein [Polaribacter aquimarinus]PWG04601.1 hypothetical protein DIS07_11695 [Polaribacter aquimarinus]